MTRLRFRVVDIALEEPMCGTKEEVDDIRRFINNAIEARRLATVPFFITFLMDSFTFGEFCFTNGLCSTRLRNEKNIPSKSSVNTNQSANRLIFQSSILPLQYGDDRQRWVWVWGLGCSSSVGRGVLPKKRSKKKSGRRFIKIYQKREATY